MVAFAAGCAAGSGVGGTGFGQGDPVAPGGATTVKIQATGWDNNFRSTADEATTENVGCR